MREPRQPVSSPPTDFLDAAALLRQAGLRNTRPRQWMIDLLQRAQASGEPVSAQRLHERLGASGREVSLSTIYRALSSLERHGLIYPYRLASGATAYALVQAGHHDRIVCVQTGVTHTFCDPEAAHRLQMLAAEYGGELVDYQLTLYVRPLCAHNGRRLNSEP